MRKFIIYNVQCIIALFFSLYIIHFIFYIPVALATDSTPSADVKAKLEALKQEIASKAAKLKQEINKKLTNKAYIGVVKSKTSASLTLAAKSGTKMVTVNQDTIYQDTSTGKSKGATMQSIKEESFIAALGDVDDTGVLTARKIIILPTTNPQPKTYLWGQVISTSDQLITIKDKASKNQSISVGKNTNLQKGKEEISFADIENEDYLIVSGVKNKNEILEADFIYLFSNKSSPKPGISATPSASIKAATSSGKKK